MKEFNGISEQTIKEAAIVYAAQFGWNVKTSDCRVKPMPGRPVKEGGERVSMTLPVSKWRVYLTSKATPYVEVQQLSGAVAATKFYGMER